MRSYGLRPEPGKLPQMPISKLNVGMTYLEAHQFVHRDLAARNILLASRHQAKISDFGLSRALGGDQYYKATQGGRWPIKWYVFNFWHIIVQHSNGLIPTVELNPSSKLANTLVVLSSTAEDGEIEVRISVGYAPESFNFGTFSHASDVWSFGVTLWEMFSFGQQPYGELRGAEVIQIVDKGNRLEQPSLCPNEVYKIMEQCWAYHPRDRPTFSQLLDIFSSDPEYINIKELLLVSSPSDGFIDPTTDLCFYTLRAPWISERSKRTAASTREDRLSPKQDKSNDGSSPFSGLPAAMSTDPLGASYATSTIVVLSSIRQWRIDWWNKPRRLYGCSGVSPCCCDGRRSALCEDDVADLDAVCPAYASSSLPPGFAIALPTGLRLHRRLEVESLLGEQKPMLPEFGQ
uniref:Protein kinase domain-containing protein n=1 Tax=Timema genevievae TaxID=629358 RepID=A0A7R9JRP4_TIMGE|nr:unnamed protein product [Timema genevievae]